MVSQNAYNLIGPSWRRLWYILVGTFHPRLFEVSSGDTPFLSYCEDVTCGQGAGHVLGLGAVARSRQTELMILPTVDSLQMHKFVRKPIESGL